MQQRENGEKKRSQESTQKSSARIVGTSSSLGMCCSVLLSCSQTHYICAKWPVNFFNDLLLVRLATLPDIIETCRSKDEFNLCPETLLSWRIRVNKSHNCQWLGMKGYFSVQLDQKDQWLTFLPAVCSSFGKESISLSSEEYHSESLTPCLSKPTGLKRSQYLNHPAQVKMRCQFPLTKRSKS